MRLVLFLVFIIFPCYAGFVSINDGSMLSSKSVEYVNSVSSELYQKSGVRVYVALLNDLPEGFSNDASGRLEYKKFLVRDLVEPYAVLLYMGSSKKIDILVSPPLKIDKNTIISDFIVPIFVKEKQLTNSIISAGVLNGYAKLAHDISVIYNVELEQNIIYDDSGSRDFVRYIAYALLAIMFLVVFWVFSSRKKDS